MTTFSFHLLIFAHSAKLENAFTLDTRHESVPTCPFKRWENPANCYCHSGQFSPRVHLHKLVTLFISAMCLPGEGQRERERKSVPSSCQVKSENSMNANRWQEKFIYAKYAENMQIKYENSFSHCNQ